MRLGIQTKISAPVVLILAIAFGASTWFTTAQVRELLSDSGQRSQEALRKAASDQARNAFMTLEKGTKDSLERGEMKVFEHLLAGLGEIKGVLEIGLADAKGKITYSNHPERRQALMDPEFFRSVATQADATERVEGENALVLARAHKMTADCLRCHTQSKPGDLAGVLFVRFSLDGLRAAETEQAAFVAEARRKGVLGGITTGLASLVATSVMAYLVLGALVRRPLARLLARARDMASGEADLTVRLPVTSSDEMGDVAGAFNDFVENLRRLVSEVLSTAAGVSKGSEEILRASGAVLQRANEQNDRTHAAASSAEEMSVTVSEVARGAQQAESVAQSVAKTADEGKNIVEEGVSGMSRVEKRVQAIADTVRELGSRSQAIGEVMQVIDDIADQTNLLALNAAIEAARAGEHGRGFAVVADEVRKLSEKTAQATRQVRDTVASIQKETGEAIFSVKTGLEEVSQSGELSRSAGIALREIMAKIKQNSDTVTAIASATEEQSAAVAEISRNLDSVAELAGEVVSGVQQTSATAERLGTDIRHLEELVGRFKV